MIKLNPFAVTSVTKHYSRWLHSIPAHCEWIKFNNKSHGSDRCYWGSIPCHDAVSYTHLDVYKRQVWEPVFVTSVYVCVFICDVKRHNGGGRQHCRSIDKSNNLHQFICLLHLHQPNYIQLLKHILTQTKHLKLILSASNTNDNFK